MSALEIAQFAASYTDARRGREQIELSQVWQRLGVRGAQVALGIRVGRSDLRRLLKKPCLIQLAS
jgi:hypothetical protein